MKTEEAPEALSAAMWRNWAISFGAIILPLVFSLFTRLTWLPFIALAEVYVLASLRRAEMLAPLSRCSVVSTIVIRTLTLSAAIMIIINILCTDFLIPTVFHMRVFNSEIPFIVCLIEAPVTVFFCILSLFEGLDSKGCRDCQRRNGYYAGDSMAATLYYREARYQTSVLLTLSIAMGIVEYFYYFARYINANFNDPDRFFFVYMPIAVYALSLPILYFRYTNMGAIYTSMLKSTGAHHDGTLVRYLIFCGDNMLLRQNDDEKWDTPAEARIPHHMPVGEYEARHMFSEITGNEAFGIRYCFTNRAFASNTKMTHYAVFLENETDMPADDTRVWFNPYLLDNALAANALSPVLANELYRIHTITMAWKTYDREGRRLYPIKHYRPTFRLRDLREWTVDYDDETWFDIAGSNEDRRFFRTRRLWNRITNLIRPRTKSPMG